MERLNPAGDRLALKVRGALLVAGLFTYLISPDDVVWRFVKGTSHPRLWEHVCFGAAAAMLGAALLLKIHNRADIRRNDRGLHLYTRAASADLLQAVAIGCLLPLPGFLLLVSGTVGASLLLHLRHAPAESPGNGPQAPHGRDSLAANHPEYQTSDPSLQANHAASQVRGTLSADLGLCCAFFSMVVFSITLIDRVADVLFAATALISVAPACREALRGRARSS